MSWSVVGLVASLVPWGVVLLTSTGVVFLPCWDVGTAAVKAGCCVAVVVALFASVAGLRRRVARATAVTGLALGLAFGTLFVLSEPATVGAFAIPAAAVGFAVTQWR